MPALFTARELSAYVPSVDAAEVERLFAEANEIGRTHGRLAALLEVVPDADEAHAANVNCPKLSELVAGAERLADATRRLARVLRRHAV